MSSKWLIGKVSDIFKPLGKNNENVKNLRGGFWIIYKKKFLSVLHLTKANIFFSRPMYLIIQNIMIIAFFVREVILFKMVVERKEEKDDDDDDGESSLNINHKKGSFIII